MGGALTYSTAGEISPLLTLENNRFINNCRQLYGNFSTCEAAIKLDVQNMQAFHFQVSQGNSIPKSLCDLGLFVVDYFPCVQLGNVFVRKFD